MLVVLSGGGGEAVCAEGMVSGGRGGAVCTGGMVSSRTVVASGFVYSHWQPLPNSTVGRSALVIYAIIGAMNITICDKADIFWCSVVMLHYKV